MPAGDQQGSIRLDANHTLGVSQVGERHRCRLRSLFPHLDSLHPARIDLVRVFLVTTIIVNGEGDFPLRLDLPLLGFRQEIRHQAM